MRRRSRDGNGILLKNVAVDLVVDGAGSLKGDCVLLMSVIMLS